MKEETIRSMFLSLLSGISAAFGFVFLLRAVQMRPEGFELIFFGGLLWSMAIIFLRMK